jgi:hypothetical protein
MGGRNAAEAGMIQGVPMSRTGATQLRLTRPTFDTSGPDARLAELVAHLTGCGPFAAVGAVDDALPPVHDDLTVDDRIAVVAQAIVTVRREQVSLRARRPA